MPAATRITASTFGLLAAYAGIEHGVGELRQGFEAPDSIFIESWPDTRAFEALGGEPAMTLIPSLAFTGVIAILVSLAIGVWAVWFVGRRHGALVLTALSVLLLLVGGGFGPAAIGVMAGFTASRMRRHSTAEPGAATRALARAWPWALIACVLGYLALVPGVVLLTEFADFDNSSAVTAIIVFAFGALVLSIAAARGADRLREATRGAPAADTTAPAAT